MRLTKSGEVDGRSLRPRRPIKNSRLKAALILMQATPVVSQREYLAILAAVCETKTQMHNLSSHLVAGGFVARPVHLTDKGIQRLRETVYEPMQM